MPGDKMIRLTIFLLLLSLLCLPVRAGSSSPVRAGGRAYEAELRADIDEHLKAISGSRVYKKRLRMAQSLVPVVLEQSWAHSVDPLLVNSVIKKESSWNVKAEGKKGERGLMQIMPGHKNLAGLDLFDGRVNISAGVEILGNCVRECETLPEALSFYITGNGCQPVIRAAKRRAKAYRADVKRYRK
jgi:hypothetical protein